MALFRPRAPRKPAIESFSSLFQTLSEGSSKLVGETRISFVWGMPQCRVQPLPGTVETPDPKVMVDGFPRWQIMGQQAPGTATPYDIENGVQDLTQGVNSWSSIGLWRR